jgi:glycosyltransferase involved in cell wall biosynthesis
MDSMIYVPIFDAPNSTILSLTNTMKKYLIKHFYISSRKVRTVYDTIDPRIYRERYALSRKIKSPRLIFMGDVYYRDGVDVAVRALKTVIKQYPNTKLIITGTGPFLPEVLRLAKELDILENVESAGWLSFEELADLLSKVSIGLVPCRNLLINRLIIPRKTFEYMAAGVPTIASDLDAMREIIENGVTGLLVPPEDHCELAEAILKLLSSDKLYEKIQIRAKENIVQHNYRVQLGIRDVFKHC